jgi:V8-like Glu-specific endopeptidase
MANGAEQDHLVLRQGQDKGGWLLVFLGLVVLTIFAPIAVRGMPGVWRPAHALTRDNRVVRDRLHPRNNPGHEDYAFLNAVGAVWPTDIKRSAVGYSASTGFLIDRCHVLTSMHAVYADDIVIHPSVGKSVEFGVGQTEGEGNRGALQGLKFLLSGVVVAHGDAIIVNHLVHNPQNDWALIRLAANVDDSIRPLTIGAVDGAQLPKNLRLSLAGFPADLRERRGDRFELKDLWESDGQVVGVVWASTAGAVIESTVQATPGNSGGPLYGDLNGREHIVIGMAQGIRGNGIDVSDSSPNIQVLFTPDTLARIGAARALTPCLQYPDNR